MTSTTRLQPAAITEVFGMMVKRLSKKLLGEVPEPIAVRQTAHRAREHVAARRPRRQVDRSEQRRVVERFPSKFATLAPTAVLDTVWLNGALGGRIVLDGQLNTVISFVIDDGLISRMYAVRNPHKLVRLHQEAVIAR